MGIKSAKYDTHHLVFKTHNTVIVFSNGFPNTEALKEDRWSIYEIKGEELCKKTPTKTLQTLIMAHKNYTIFFRCRLASYTRMVLK